MPVDIAPVNYLSSVALAVTITPPWPQLQSEGRCPCLSPPPQQHNPPLVKNLQSMPAKNECKATCRFVMFYEAVAADNTRTISLAVSKDGVKGWKCLGHPILTAGAPGLWDAEDVGAPCAVSMAGTAGSPQLLPPCSDLASLLEGSLGDW